MSNSFDPCEQTESAEIPFWVGGNQKWISGIRNITTCGDILKALLKSDSKYAHHTDVLLKFVLVERWRKVEKPLRSDSKILKIYQAWGQEISDVKFVVKRLHSSSRSSSGNNTSSRVRRSDSKLWRQNRIGCSTDTIHPKCLSESEDDSKPLNPRVEKLIKTILAQGESIQAELLRLTSVASSNKSGDDKDYLLKHYLGSIPEKPEDSGCTSEERDDKSQSPHLRITRQGDEDEGDINEADISFFKRDGEEEDPGNTTTSSIDPGAIHLWTELFEKIFNMNQKLAVQEDELHNLSRKMKSYLDAPPESIVDLELQSASAELSQATELNSVLGREIRRNEIALGHLAKNYDGRKVFANRLEIDVNRAESFSIKLKKELAERSSPPGESGESHQVPTKVSHIEKTVRFNDREQILATPEPPPKSVQTCSSSSPVKKSILKVGPDGHPLDAGDSNSDTGLSSMHSSSSEDGSSPVTTAGYGLDTLV
uniref:AGAP011031PAlike [Tribolium castaneum] n=1 Tax=Lepeophtheirus salmonis TaxID=72036 RepID=A0A0K2UZF3_LEPSM